MCRLFGSLHAGAPPLRSHLLASATSLLAQSKADPKRLQQDGWGVGHYNRKGKPSITLSTNPVFKEVRAFTGAVKNVSGHVAIAHLRAASNPLGLDRSLILRPESQQPFTYRKWLFAHNGTIKLPDTLMASLGKYRKLVRGRNDSEVYFWLLMRAMDETSTVRDAFSWTVDAIMRDWEKAPAERKNEAKVPYLGLNCLLSDQKRLWALCKYDDYRPKGTDNWLIPAKPPRPLFEMCYHLERDGRGIVAASERTEPGGVWVPLRDGSLLEASLSRGLVQYSVERLG